MTRRNPNNWDEMGFLDRIRSTWEEFTEENSIEIIDIFQYNDLLYQALKAKEAYGIVAKSIVRIKWYDKRRCYRIEQAFLDSNENIIYKNIEKKKGIIAHIRFARRLDLAITKQMQSEDENVFIIDVI